MGNGWGRTPQKACKRAFCADGVVVGVVVRKVKKGANKALGRDENAAKRWRKRLKFDFVPEIRESSLARN